MKEPAAGTYSVTTRLRCVVFVVVVTVLASSCAGFDDKSSADEAWFTDHGVTFVYPDDWESLLEEHLPPPPAWGAIRSPDTSSGNWLAFYYYPSSVAADFNFSAPESFHSFLDDFLQDGLTLTHGPSATTIAGFEGQEFGVAGVLAERPDDPFESELVVLYGEEATYGLQVQYEPGSEDIMLSAWQTMLSNFNISS